MIPDTLAAFHAFMAHANRLSAEITRPGAPAHYSLLWCAWHAHGTTTLTCPALRDANTAHATLALTPLVARAQDAWIAWWAAVQKAAPGLDPIVSIEAHHKGHPTSPVFHLRTDRRLGPALTPPELEATIAAYLAATHGIPLGTHRFTITGDLPPQGGCPRSLSLDTTAASAEDAVRIWQASHALVGDAYPITAITQAHDPARVIARAAQARRTPALA